MQRILKSGILTLMLCLSVFMFAQSAAAGGKVYSCKTYSYDCCTGCYYPVVTTYKTHVVKYQGYTCQCGCPKYYSYYKHYSYPVKSVKYYKAVSLCNTCNTCNSCNY
jgi:hypothetical protein